VTDTGPPYPRYAPGFEPGSNGIGQFQIGVSPIGELSPYDEWASVISQYANSPILTAMISSFNAAVDQTENIEDLYDMVWNVLTAEGWGLDVWGRIVGVIRTLHLPGGATNYIGFNEAGSSWTGFGQGGFYSGGALTENYVLADNDFRRLVLAKAATNICDGSIPAINAILLRLFPLRGNSYVIDGLDMTMTYRFEFPLTPVELAIVLQSGALPNPCGVVISILQS
jgi:hypothetical protein